ncbi:sel1 repeat family protein [Agrobacterium tumefaciens]|uniref:Sel1 repeat family protein n=1 Tax=Agrobacterium tumefaciens TaxID=358 RepID=A0A2L2LJ26_AGRTU|nr:tetratricopeptide repeat protein [Agrobacterium tumefaciens]AVH44343.1 hypothetical protein At1D1609_42980 [Agrobacterium tumefaciens]NSY98266.1 sel1 repeat family protein [Agrobacterium tumefaciens]NSZ03290.1 sel1 repeat family protein [Agrobacterium tumefaciens]NSZ38506.1 sel1 repeat family protein [Agrobacterium tumefaciens]NTB04148.1 sel1 repeat family protein [Agrobacterium tumefaciens]
MKQPVRYVFAAFAIFIYLLQSYSAALAGYDEAYAFYQSGDFVRAMAEWRPMAEQGEQHAQFAMGTMYKEGEGVAADAQQAIDWFRKAAEQGHAGSQYELGRAYVGLWSPGSVSIDRELGISWLKKAADQGYLRAKSKLILVGATPVYASPDPNEPLQPSIPDETHQTYGSRIFGPIYDIIGWIIVSGLFLYVALRPQALPQTVQKYLPAWLFKRSVLLLLAVLTSFLAVIQILREL